jgi:hypothetical protein
MGATVTEAAESVKGGPSGNTAESIPAVSRTRPSREALEPDLEGAKPQGSRKPE